jgi:replication-associated recombination protein RarA
MARRQLAVSLRPKGFSEIIGQDSVLNAIRGRYNNGVEQAAWMFTGPTGTGKTTLAGILALWLQCRHGEVGEPCEDCRLLSSSFQIKDINASKITTKEAVEDVIRSSENRPFPPSKRNIFILDEAQKLSDGSQNLLLKYLEEPPPTTVWILCTSEKNKILETLQRRCRVLKLKPLGIDDIKKIVIRGMKRAKADFKARPVENIATALYEEKVWSPALILNGVENYLDGQPAKEAVKNLVEGYDTLAICRSLMRGNWDDVRKETSVADPDELRGIRKDVAAYLRKVLEDKGKGPRAKEASAGINLLAQVDAYTDATQGPATVAVLYLLCEMMAREDIDA